MLPLIDHLQIRMVGNLTVYEGTVGRHEVSAITCGIGKVNSAVRTLTLINDVHPDLVINTGVAGGAAPDIHTLDILVADGVAYHDVWCGPGTVYGAADGFEAILRPESSVISAATECMPGKLHTGLICSGDRFIDSAREVQGIRKHFPEVKAVDMESASIAQVCVMRGVAFSIIRVISDNPESGDNIAQYNNFWDDAPQTTFAALRMLLERL